MLTIHLTTLKGVGKSDQMNEYNHFSNITFILAMLTRDFLRDRRLSWPSGVKLCLAKKCPGIRISAGSDNRFVTSCKKMGTQTLDSDHNKTV